MNVHQKQKYFIIAHVDAQETERKGRKKTKREMRKEYRIVTFLAAAASLLTVLYPLLPKGLYMGTDAPFHLARIESLYLALKEGVFPAKIHFAEAYSFGYGVGFFYPDCFLYFPALLRLMGLSLETSYKIYAVAVTVTAWLNMYTAVELLGGRKRRVVSACGAAMYIMSLQYTRYLYSVQAVGSYTAMAFLPVCIGELLNILHRDYRRRDLVLFTCGAVCVLLSHVSTAILLIVFLLVMVLVSADRIVKKPVILRDLVCCALGGAFLSVGFWLPALEQLSCQKYHFQTNPLYPVSEQTVSWSQFPSAMGIGMMLLCVFLVIAFLQTLGRHGEMMQKRILWSGLTATFLFIVLVFCSMFWKTFGHYCEFVQFPSRLLGPATAGAVLMFCLWEENQGHFRRIQYALLALLVVSFAWQTLTDSANYGERTSPGSELFTDQIAGLGAGEEWMPDEAVRDELKEPEKSYDPTKGGADGTKYEHGKYYEVYVPLHWEYYDVPYLYYKGYEAYLLDESGQPARQLRTGKSDSGGCVRVYLPEGEEGIGHIMVVYRKTSVQKISYSINVMTVLFFLWVCMRNTRWYKSKWAKK